MTGGEGSQWTKTEAGEWVFYAFDYAYKYWILSEGLRLSGAGSPLPRVAMQPGPNGPEVSALLMKAPRPDPQVLSELTNKIGLLSDQQVDKAMVQVGWLMDAMLDLIYSGNPESAFQLLEMVWPEGFQLDYVKGIDRAYFKGRLVESVRSSNYYQAWFLGE